MKKIFLLLIISFVLSSCEKDNIPSKPLTELDKLPPATQIGANTVGCLLDGKAFKPGYYPNSVNCFYQYVRDYYYPDGGYFFNISLDNRDSNNNLHGLWIGTSEKQIFEGQTYNLLEPVKGNAYGGYLFFMYNSDDAAQPVPIPVLTYETTQYGPYYTSQTHTGELKITKFDPQKYFVSGTFWFDVKDSNGVVHQIREGRFDMHYTN